jgi:ParB family transcriptional regulator, chromosome partitioning protein
MARKSLDMAVARMFVENSEPNSLSTIPLNKIKKPKKQPRKYFDPDKMANLVSSIKDQGVLEPILVRPIEGGFYELVAGERRLRATEIAGLDEIPAVSREMSDEEVGQVALMENLQREDLSPVEETEAVLEVLAFKLKIEVKEVKSVIYQIANAKSRNTPLNTNVHTQGEEIEECLAQLGRFNMETLRNSRLPILNLPEDVLDALRSGSLEYTKGRALGQVKDEKQRKELLHRAIEEKLSLTEIKNLISKNKTGKTRAKTQEQELKSRLALVTKRFKIPTEKRKVSRLIKLLEELEQLTEEF